MRNPEYAPLHDADAIVVEELELDEEVELETIPLDPRLAHLSEATRRHIDLLYGGDVDDAACAASRLCCTYRNPPAWALEIHGAQRQGWKNWAKEMRR